MRIPGSKIHMKVSLPISAVCSAEFPPYTHCVLHVTWRVKLAHSQLFELLEEIVICLACNSEKAEGLIHRT